MKYIIIESSLYKITEKQYSEIIELEDNLKKEFPNPSSPISNAELKLNKHLSDNKNKFKYLGEVGFHYRY